MCRACAGEPSGGANGAAEGANDSADEGGLFDMFAKRRDIIPLDLIIGELFKICFEIKTTFRE